MRFSSALPAFVGMASASDLYLTERQMQDNGMEILSGITQISSNVLDLNSTLTRLPLDPNGDIGIAQLLGINSAGMTVGKSIDNATAAANSSTGPLAQSLEVAGAALSLQPGIFTLLDNFVAHGMVFMNKGIAPIVLSTLQTQRNQTKVFGDLVASLLAQPYQDEAVPVNQAILDKFDDTIMYFSSNGTSGGNPTLFVPSPGPNNKMRVIAWVNKTRDDSNSLNNTLNQISGDGKIALPMLEQLFYASQNLTADITNAIGLANDSAAWNISDSNDVALSTLNLQPTVFSLLANFRSKQAAFATSGQTGLVAVQLEGQSMLTQQLGVALANKLSLPYILEAPVLLQKFVEAFNQTIDAFGGVPTGTPTPAPSTGAASAMGAGPAFPLALLGTVATVFASGLFGASLIL